MLVLMFSTAGVPPFVGFWAKLWIIQALLDTQHVWLVTFAVLTSVVGAFYYLRVIWFMYFDAGREQAPIARLPLTRGCAGAQYAGRGGPGRACPTCCWRSARA